jgi:hypothetical protein
MREARADDDAVVVVVGDGSGPPLAEAAGVLSSVALCCEEAPSGSEVPAESAQGSSIVNVKGPSLLN